MADWYGEREPSYDRECNAGYESEAAWAADDGPGYRRAMEARDRADTTYLDPARLFGRVYAPCSDCGRALGVGCWLDYPKQYGTPEGGAGPCVGSAHCPCGGGAEYRIRDLIPASAASASANNGEVP